MLCKRIIIMDKGRSIVTGTNEELKAMISTSEKIVVGFSEVGDETIQKMKSIPHVMDIEKAGEDYIIKFENGFNNLANLMEFIQENELTYTKLHSQLPSLNDVFLELTGKELRD